MRKTGRFGALLCGIFVASAVAPTLPAAEYNGPVRVGQPAADHVPGRFIVIWKGKAQIASASKLAAVAKVNGIRVERTRDLLPRMQLVELATTSETTSDSALADLRADPNVEYADYDYRRFAKRIPDDPDYLYTTVTGGQWYLQSAVPTAVANIHADAAWDVTTGSNGIVVADLDTGIRYDHPDIARATAGGKVLPGYDFVSSESGGTSLSANDGDGRDADPSDPGDWITSSESAAGPFAGCQASGSSWHGTRTAGIIGALTDNHTGIAGVNWNAYILPVRVLGKCGGFDSDITDGMLWAAGIHVAGVPDNPYPARIINMSLGGTGACAGIYPSIFTQLTAAGVTVVVSAGNEGGSVDVPGNCPGAIAVAGLRHIGTKVGFSSLGPEVALSAPGGNCVNTGAGQPCLYTIDTLTDAGTTTPVGPAYTDQSNFNVGTSFSAPLVSGVASLMLALNQNFQPTHLRIRLRNGATTPFPKNPDPTIVDCVAPGGALQTTECNCTNQTCGAGMLNAQGAINEALRPIASVAVPATFTAGSTVNLQGSRSVAACGRTIGSYAWTVVAGPGSLTSNSAADTSILAPPAGMTTNVHVVVTDNMGATDSADIAIASTSAVSTMPTITPVDPCPTPISVPQLNLPTATFSASPTSISSGQSSTLTWSSTDATSCTAGGDWTGNKAASGNQSTGVLTATKTYTLSCIGGGGTSDVKTVVVTVTGTSSGGGGGGGGGDLGLVTLAGLAGLLALSRRRSLH